MTGPLPNAMIIGVQKGGTTSLHNLLDRHDDIYFPKSPVPQEIHFFDLDENYAKGIDWYRSLFDGHAKERVVAQTSPLYLYLPEVAERIHSELPECKFIVTLRNPVDRAHSHYWHEVRWGFETLSMMDALESESSRITRGPYERRNFSYVSRGRYDEQVQRFTDLFGPDQVLILRQDELRADSDAVARRCAKFLGVDPEGFAPEPASRTVFNSAKMPRSQRLQTLRPRLEKVSSKLAGSLDRINLIDARYPDLSHEERAFLTAQFADQTLFPPSEVSPESPSADSKTPK